MYKVLGHTCDGLVAWQTEDRYCAIGINADGTIFSCDADSNIPISFCPFCGTKLPETEMMSPFPTDCI